MITSSAECSWLEVQRNTVKLVSTKDVCYIEPAAVDRRYIFLAQALFSYSSWQLTKPVHSYEELLGWTHHVSTQLKTEHFPMSSFDPSAGISRIYIRWSRKWHHILYIIESVLFIPAATDSVTVMFRSDVTGNSR